jgi:hypothetical protein
MAMRCRLTVGTAALVVLLVVGGSGASARVEAGLGGWKTAIYPHAYFGPNSSYRPSLNIDFRTHQSFDVDMTQVTRHRIGEIVASVKVPCSVGGTPVPPAPIHANNMLNNETPRVPVKIAPDGSFSMTQPTTQFFNLQAVFRMNGRFHGRTGSGTLSYDIVDQPLPNPQPGGPTTISCHSGLVTWHVTWHKWAPSSG